MGKKEKKSNENKDNYDPYDFLSSKKTKTHTLTKKHIKEKEDELYLLLGKYKDKWDSL